MRAATTASGSSERSASEATKTAKRLAPASPHNSVAPRLAGSRSLRCRALSHREERGRFVHAPRGEARRRARSVSGEALRGRRGPRRHAKADPGVRLYGKEARRRRSRRVAKGRRGVPFHCAAEFRLRLEKRPRRGQSGTHGKVEQRLRGGLRPQTQVVEAPRLRKSGLRTAPGEDAGRLKTTWAALR